MEVFITYFFITYLVSFHACTFPSRCKPPSAAEPGSSAMRGALLPSLWGFSLLKGDRGTALQSRTANREPAKNGACGVRPFGRLDLPLLWQMLPIFPTMLATFAQWPWAVPLPRAEPSDVLQPSVSPLPPLLNFTSCQDFFFPSDYRYFCGTNHWNFIPSSWALPPCLKTRFWEMSKNLNGNSHP